MIVCISPGRYLMEFLNELSKYADVTKMNVSNLALVIGPNLLWPQADGRLILLILLYPYVL